MREIFILLVAALSGIFDSGEAFNSPKYWLWASEPYLYEMSGHSPSYSFSWGNGSGGWTYVQSGGCTGRIGLGVKNKGEDIIPFFILHEFSHVNQGFSCVSFDLINVEQTASLMAIEALAEMCRDDVYGACHAFWYAIYDRAYFTLYRPFVYSNNYQAYHGGLVKRLLEGPEVRGAALQKPLVLDDAWSLLGPRMAKIKEIESRMK